MVLLMETTGISGRIQQGATMARHVQEAAIQ
jgi:hypothetical protein